MSVDYQSDFICTYKLMDTPEEQEQLYRLQLLQAFNMTVWDDTKVNYILGELYKDIRNSPDFCLIFEKSMLNADIQDLLIKFCAQDDCNEKEDEKKSEDEESEDKIYMIFIFFFNFKYFDLIHRCLCDFLRNKHEIAPQIAPQIAPAVLNTFLNAL